MLLRLLIPSLALASLIMLSACSGGSNDNSSPPQANQPAPSPGQTNSPPAQTPTPQPPAPTPTPTPPPAASLDGHVSLTNLTLSGISATFTAPIPARGGQEEVVVVQDPMNMRDEHTALNVAWRDIDVTTHLDPTGTATYHVDATSLETSILFTGAGTINTAGGRFGDILAGETGELTVTVHYTLIPTPGATSTGSVDLTLWNITTDELKGISAELPTADEHGTLNLTVHFNAGDTGSLQYLVSLGSEKK